MSPDVKLAQHKYRHLAGSYDRQVRLTEGVRRRTIALLDLRPSDTVLDVGCGTGLSFPLIEEGIGPDGRVIGIDASAEMLAKAWERIESASWQNVTLVESPVESAEIPGQADAVLFHFVHDITRSPAAIENVFRHAKPGARVAAAGGKRAPLWAVPVNLVMWRISRRYITTFEGFDRPWDYITRYVPDLRVRSTLFGAVYIAWGNNKPAN